MDVAARLLPGASTHPALLSLARLLLVRSVRCRRLQGAYRTQARAMLHLQRERLADDFRPALWLGALHLIEGRLSEARRSLEAAERLAGSARAVAAKVAHVARLAGEARAPSARPWRDDPAAHGDPVLEALVAAAVRRGLSGGGRVEVTLPAPAAGRAGSERLLQVRAGSGGPVVLQGPGGRRRLSPLEGELLLALLSLVWASGAPGGRLQRDVWVGAIWPVAPGAVGRMDGLFSAAIRSLRLQAWALARRPVLEASRREGYGLAPDVAIRLSLDLPSVVADWLLLRIPPPGAAEGTSGGGG